MDTTHIDQTITPEICELEEELALLGFSDDLIPNPDSKDIEKQQQNREKYSKIYSNCDSTLITQEMKEQRYRAYVLQKRKNKKMRKTQKHKENKATKTYPDPEHTYVEIIALKKEKKRLVNEKLESFKNGGCRVVVDLSFSDVMLPKEIKSLASQLGFCMNAVKKGDFPIHLNLCSYTGNIKIEGEKMGFDKVNISYHEKPVEVVFANTTGQLVYLSPDAEEELESFEPENVYIIGGLVDNQIQKNASMDRATEMKVITRKLPLDFVDNIKKFRKCLNINTMVEIVVAYFSEMDMRKAIMKALPPRYFNTV